MTDNIFDKSVFASAEAKIYNQRFAGSILVEHLVGGIPSNPKVAEPWLRKKLGEVQDDLFRQMVQETIMERHGVDQENLPPEDAKAAYDDAVDHLMKQTSVNGFKRDANGLYIEGRQAKAMLKEAVNVAWPWPTYKITGDGKVIRSGGSEKASKGVKSFIAEHIFVLEQRLYLGRDEPSGVQQRFVHTHRGAGITYEEYVEDATFDFTVVTDVKFPQEWWEKLWVTAQKQGIGATRSQGFGRFAVTKWETIK